MIEKLVLILTSYLVGAIPFGLFIGKIVKHIDVRDYGSGNIGATNVFRVVGKGWGIVVLILDCMKGFLPTMFVKMRYAGDMTISFIVGIATILGHTWPVFLNFKGGKGIATTLGVTLSLFPIPTLITLCIFVIVVYLTGYVSVGSIISVACFPVLILIYNFPTVLVITVCILSCILVYKHKENIKRLMNNEENKLFSGLAMKLFLRLKNSKKTNKPTQLS